MQSRRAGVILLVAVGIALVPPATWAQQAGKVFRIGFLASGPRPSEAELQRSAFRKALGDLGYVAGQNTVFESRYAEGNIDRLPDLAGELVHARVDVIVTVGGPAAEAAKIATSTIPIVIAAAGDPVGTGLIASLARPGGNVTGITDQAIELSAKRLQLLKEAVPKATLMALLWNTADRAMTLRSQQVEGAARTLGVTIRALGVREPKDFDAAFAAMTRERPGALYLVTDVLARLNRRRIIEYAATHRIPAMYEVSDYVKDGGLMSYGPSFADMFPRAAYYVDRILKGAKPADLPVEQPTRYYLVINLKTAKALGLTLPQSLLIRMDEVIQ